MFSEDKGDNIDMRMIKITIKANQIDMDVLLISKVDNIQKPYLSLKSGFFHYFILVCEFYPHRQTWYQKFIRTYPPLHLLGKMACILLGRGSLTNSVLGFPYSVGLTLKISGILCFVWSIVRQSESYHLA